jgi:hypothetical protein
MKALSIIQPWAWLIVNGYKDVENRDWPTRVRGRVWIHAGKKFDDEGYAFVAKNFPHIPLPSKASFRRGGVVGQATITDCVSGSASPWFFGDFGFVLADAKPVEFIPCAGALGFFSPAIAEATA